jgi:hypothetical protein
VFDGGYGNDHHLYRFYSDGTVVYKYLFERIGSFSDSALTKSHNDGIGTYRILGDHITGSLKDSKGRAWQFEGTITKSRLSLTDTVDSKEQSGSKADYTFVSLAS